ncbi:MAG TPA: GAF domain-containing protein, partial [Burkholderiaceae bacterium]|nr:GAF domain-containing protein [Burkholderiaceae bacterium]
VVSGIKIGRSGLAYVVDANGTLIAHPDISLVLKKTDLSELPQVAAVLHGGAESATAHDLAGHEVLAAHERIPGLNWTVFVETPRGEALAPLRDTVWRLVWLLIGGLLLAAAESFFLARALVRPIEALQRGAERVGAGELDQRIEVKTGDELEGLAEQFNQMGAALQASYAGLERKVEDRTRELSDALQQQTATAEVLQVISSSMADARPVFDKILDSCSKLFDSLNTSVMLIGDDGKLHLGASHGTPPEMRALYPMALGDTGTELAIRERRVLNFPDVLNGDGVPQGVRAPALAVGRTCSQMQAPLLWDERGIGSIVVVRGEVGGFTQKECELLRTFADQAVIAIQNARLFNETKEALERQTATSEVLRVISGSITDTQPVFDIIAERAVRLTGGEFGQVFRFNGEWVHIISTFGMSTEGTAAIRKAFPMRPSEGAVTSRAVRDGVVVNVPDVLAEPGIDPAIVRTSQQAGFRAVVSVPMIRDGQVIGAISVNRAAVGRFADKEVELLQTFASQAMIAIENVRLFNETREALEHQTATAEVLQVISGSVSNAAPVFEKILDSCERLFGASDLGIFLTGEDDVLRAGAFRGILMKTTASTYPRPLAGTVSGLAIAKGSVLHVPDMLAANEMPPYIREFASHVGNFSVALAPMMWEGRGIGTIDIIRAPPRPYSEKELALLKTFADQAVIAIQNARLFNETKEALEQQTATAEVLSVISSSVADTAPVFDKILDSCTRLFAASGLGIYLADDAGMLHNGGFRGATPESVELLRAV